MTRFGMRSNFLKNESTHLLAIDADSNVLPLFILLHSKHDRWNVEVAKYRINEVDLLGFRPDNVLATHSMTHFKTTELDKCAYLVDIRGSNQLCLRV